MVCKTKDGKALGAKSTAIEALQGADLTGKTALVTGGNSGLGVETVRALAHAGAHVVLTSRRPEAGQEVAGRLNKEGLKGDVAVLQLDLTDVAAVRAAARTFQAQEKRLDILVLNAGVMATDLEYTKDGFELQIATNHFGHFVLATELLPLMQAQGTPARVVALSSYLHSDGQIALEDLHWRARKYDRWKAYGQAKLANVLFARELARRQEGTLVKAFAVHPGVIPTGLTRHIGFKGLMFRTFGRPWLKTPPQGAATSVYAAVAPELEAHSGAYLADCAIATPGAAARDADLARKLWAVTEEQVAAALKGKA